MAVMAVGVAVWENCWLWLQLQCGQLSGAPCLSGGRLYERCLDVSDGGMKEEWMEFGGEEEKEEEEKRAW